MHRSSYLTARLAKLYKLQSPHPARLKRRSQHYTPGGRIIALTDRRKFSVETSQSSAVGREGRRLLLNQMHQVSFHDDADKSRDTKICTEPSFEQNQGTRMRSGEVD
jgi:hypothetical protein